MKHFTKRVIPCPLGHHRSHTGEQRVPPIAMRSPKRRALRDATLHSRRGRASSNSGHVGYAPPMTLDLHHHD
jgi:hypothetical protein